MLNDLQIARLVRHACDKNGHDELADMTFYFVDVPKDVDFAVSCESNGYCHRPSIKFYAGFKKLNDNKQIEAVIRATCEAINLYRVKELGGRPSKQTAGRLYKKAVKRTEVETT